MDKNKEIQRKKLLKQRNKNIKKAIFILIILMLAFISVNRFYRNYQEDLYQDKRVIMNNCNFSIRELTSYMSLQNSLITDLLFENDVTDEYSYFSTRTNFLSAMTKGIHYDREKYTIDYHYDLGRQLQQNGYSILAALKKDILTEDDKKVLADILQANNQVLDVWGENINYIQNSVKQHELDYIYYYEGEMVYILSNAMTAAMDDIGRIEKTPTTHTSTTPAEKKQKPLTATAAKEYAQEFYHIFLGGEKALNNVGASSVTHDSSKSTSEHFENESGSDLLSLSYGTDDFTEGEKIIIHLDEKVLSYMGPPHIVEDQIAINLIEEKAASLVTQLNQPLLVKTTDPSIINKSMGIQDRFVRIQYTIMDSQYIDHRSYIDFTFFVDGRLKDVDISNVSLLDTPYEKVSDVLTKDEVLSKLDPTIYSTITGIMLNASYYTFYEVYVTKYNQGFVVRVDAYSGEVLSIYNQRKYPYF